jgi:hypothetical protein
LQGQRFAHREPDQGNTSLTRRKLRDKYFYNLKLINNEPIELLEMRGAFSFFVCAFSLFTLIDYFNNNKWRSFYFAFFGALLITTSIDGSFTNLNSITDCYIFQSAQVSG